jgi:integrase
MLERKYHQQALCPGPRSPFGHIYTQEEIDGLMAAARKLFSPRGLRCHTYYHLVGLLTTTGMRSGEAVRLADTDVNLAEGLLTIRESKFGKSRIVPLHPTTVRALAAYKVRRDAFLKRAEAPAFFVNERRAPIGSPHNRNRPSSHLLRERPAQHPGADVRGPAPPPRRPGTISTRNAKAAAAEAAHARSGVGGGNAHLSDPISPALNPFGLSVFFC